MDINTKELQSHLLDLMRILHEVCDRNSIEYYMLGGTMLGAVRHQGFIPWDDDMDIGIPREGYEKLLALPESEWPDFIQIKTNKNSEDLLYPYSKLMNANTTLVEDRLDGIVEGIYIDIFPLDGAGNHDIFAKLHFYRFFWKLGLLYNNQDHGRKSTLPRRIVQWYARKRNTRKLYSNVEKCLKSVSFTKSRLIGNFPGAWGFREVMPKSIMGKPRLYKFEDMMLYGPEAYDLYLKSLYGDYMKLPPVEKRKSHHRFIHVDLNLPYKLYKK